MTKIVIWSKKIARIRKLNEFDSGVDPTCWDIDFIKCCVLGVIWQVCSMIFSYDEQPKCVCLCVCSPFFFSFFEDWGIWAAQADWGIWVEQLKQIGAFELSSSSRGIYSPKETGFIPHSLFTPPLITFNAISRKIQNCLIFARKLGKWAMYQFSSQFLSKGTCFITRAYKGLYGLKSQ